MHMAKEAMALTMTMTMGAVALAAYERGHGQRRGGLIRVIGERRVHVLGIVGYGEPVPYCRRFKRPRHPSRLPANFATGASVCFPEKT